MGRGLLQLKRYMLMDGYKEKKGRFIYDANTYWCMWESFTF